MHVTPRTLVLRRHYAKSKVDDHKVGRAPGAAHANDDACVGMWE
jgi:hypothetical protein